VLFSLTPASVQLQIEGLTSLKKGCDLDHDEARQKLLQCKEDTGTAETERTKPTRNNRKTLDKFN